MVVTFSEMLDCASKMTCLSFAPQDNELMVTLHIISDYIVENVGTTEEIFLVRLTTENNLVQVDLMQNFATITIVDTEGYLLN